MKISVEWLKDYVEIRETPEQLKDDLTMLGLVVESISLFDGDAVLEIEVTSNRPDCLSHVGVARVVAAPPGSGGDAAPQQHRRHNQLRFVGTGTSLARV